jgi:glutamate synthase (ferredoxin)
VRNSGVKAVVEGIGDHGCEYMTGGVVVILGKTGRNFAAGMSGGIAYVFDPDQRFDSYCNMGMVIFDEMDQKDKATIKKLLENHQKYTKSTVAQEILDAWKSSVKHFVKVMPKDYKRILLEKKETLKKAI